MGILPANKKKTIRMPGNGVHHESTVKIGKGKGRVLVKGRGFLRWGIKKASVASIGVFFLAVLFVRTAWAQGAVTDDADFFKYNPYLGYEAERSEERV